MKYILLIFYICMFSWIITRWSFCKKSGLSGRQLLGAFWIRALMAIIYGVVYKYYYGGADTWRFFEASRVLYESFYENPLYFLELALGPNARKPPDYLCDIIENLNHWIDTRTYTLLRVNAFIHFISLGYYYIHAVFFAFFSFIGLVALFRVIKQFFPLKKTGIYLILFFTPSTLFWASGMHKEALSLLGLGINIYCFFRFVSKRIFFYS